MQLMEQMGHSHFMEPETARKQFPDTEQRIQDGTVLQALDALSPHDPAVCRLVLEICRPQMEELSPCPEKGWLHAIYEQLSDNMFPDEASGHPARELDAAFILYLTALESVIFRPTEAFDPLTDLIEIEESRISGSRVAGQYRRFLQVSLRDHYVALMRIGREIMPFDPASHTIGVHNIAVHTAQMAVQAGIEVDMPLVSSAALGHDIGKFGCRGEDARRIPYLHYYYTWQWFSVNGMEEIGYISANHSTWDLEFENLPIESLLLIYADFRVRGSRGEDGQETVRIYSLEEAYEMIFSKLYNMTPEKTRRYRNVYDKLQDFEHYLKERGVPVDIGQDQLEPSVIPDASLLSGQDALAALRSMTLDNSIRLMRTISTSESFDLLLEQARGEKTHHRIRTYLRLLEEYSVYMSTENKKKTLALLYELLAHQDGDVRRVAGVIMGQILANSGPKYRKEQPAAFRPGITPPTIMALLGETVELWDEYIELCLHPDHKMSASHAQRISNSLKTICGSLFACCDEKEQVSMAQPILRRLWDAEGNDSFVLVSAIANIPSGIFPADQRSAIVDRMADMLQDGSVTLQLMVLQCLEGMKRQLPELDTQIRTRVWEFLPEEGEAQNVLNERRSRILELPQRKIREDEVSGIYLSNLKNAVHWTVKLVQIDMLYTHVGQEPAGAFHTAMHLSNLLSVSEHLPVREYAGETLLKLVPFLTVDQINEITVDLLRELESGQDQISRFITHYVGKLMCSLPDKELSEALDMLETMVQNATSRSALYTLGEVLNVLPEEKADAGERVMGIVMTGISHYNEEMHQAAMVVLCRNVFSSPRIPMTRKHRMFIRLHKKLLTILSEPREGRLTFFNRAAMLNHIYRYIVRQCVTVGPFEFPEQKPAAFFPGTFDPFSVGHKRIVEEIRALGFEVYLAVDEFSWSKKTLPKLLRRQIVGMSVAAQWDTYLFPDDTPINIAMPEDLAKLKDLLPGQKWYLVAGSDVIRNASAYHVKQPGGAPEYNHIVFYRDGAEDPDAEPLQNYIQGDLQMLSLPTFFETVSSTRIREYVDKDMDVSMLVDPIVQNYIYEKGLYMRSPEQKDEVSIQEYFFRRYRSRTGGLPEVMNRMILKAARPLAVTLSVRPDSLVGWAVGHTLQVSELFDSLESIEAANYVRRHTSGRILMIDAVQADDDAEENPEHCRMLLNELLARSLESDHTYAVCRCAPEDSAKRFAIEQLGFTRVSGSDDLYYVDMRMPMMLIQDLLLKIKKPHHDASEVRQVVRRTRPKLRRALTGLYPGRLLLCFDSEMLNQALMERIQQLNGVTDVPPGVRRLGPYMCVPYGKILAEEIVPNTVTKAFHVEKCYRRDLGNFDIVEYPGYSILKNQVRTMKSFRRPVILVDDLLHKGFRLEKLDRILKEEGLSTERIIVAVLSGYGQDLMRVQGRRADCEYFIPNLHYWETESLLYPFIGGDSVEGPGDTEMLRSVNRILPYAYPDYLGDASDEGVRNLSAVALENACDILRVLEKQHQKIFNTSLTVRRLGEALHGPRLPDHGRSMKYDMSMAPSACLEDDLVRLGRIERREDTYDAY